VKKGCKRSDQAKLDATIDARHHEAIKLRLARNVVGSNPLPEEASLVACDPDGIDQGQSSACTCHATPAALACALGYAMGATTPGFLGSMHCLYSDSGRVEQPTGDLQDNGRQIADVMTCLQKGVHSFEGNSPDGRFSDIWTANDTTAKPANVCLDVTPTEKAAELDQAFGEHTIDLTAPDALDVCMAALTASPPAPIVVGTWVGPAFENATPTDVVGPETQDNAPDGGGHAIRIVGYRTIGGVRSWLVSNSWGLNWCASGRVWVSDAWVLACWEAWVMNCTLKLLTIPPSVDPDATLKP
jgi:hypothetical protein